MSLRCGDSSYADKAPLLLTGAAGCSGRKVTTTRAIYPRGKPLTLFGLQLGGVPGLFDGVDQLLGFHLALFDFYDGFVRMRYFRADYPFNFFKCGPHFFRAVDLSGHAGDGQIHSFL